MQSRRVRAITSRPNLPSWTASPASAKRPLAIDPNANVVTDSTSSICPPFYHDIYLGYSDIWDLIPDGPYDCVILLPFAKLGGSDYVAGLLARSLTEQGLRVLILRTEQSDFERPDWFPEEAVNIDISQNIARIPDVSRNRVLYELLRRSKARQIFNVNSRLGFTTFEQFGQRLSTFCKLYCY